MSITDIDDEGRTVAAFVEGTVRLAPISDMF